MNYHALYRKYRPSSFDDVFGQDAIVKILKNAANDQKISHAYLFSGPRGTGKTSIAKILAKLINCDEPKDGTSCGKCSSCLAIDNNSPDIIELDAASNNGVDEIREIKNNVLLVPTELKYKVYIIDEVHMLTANAFNALLKTLEEPPKHIVFILATTDIHKVPATIVSRCQCFEFKRIDDNDIYKRLDYICKKEKFKISEEILKKISRISNGGLRDAVSLLDKITSYSKNKITEDDFNKIVGSASVSIIEEFTDSIYTNNIKNIIKLSDYIGECGLDYLLFIDDLIDYNRNFVRNYYLNDEKIDNVNIYLNLIRKMSLLSAEMRKVKNMRILFESGVILISNELTTTNISQASDDKDMEPEKTSKKIVSQEKIISREIKQVNKNVLTEQKREENKQKNNKIDEYNKFKDVIINNCFYSASKEQLIDFKNNFFKVNDYILVEEFSKLVNYLKDIDIKVVGANEIVISCLQDSLYDEGVKNINSLEKLLDKIYNKEYKIALVTEKEWNSIRQNYVKNKKNGVSYNYIEYDKRDPIVENQPVSNISSDAIAIFGEDIVKIAN